MLLIALSSFSFSQDPGNVTEEHGYINLHATVGGLLESQKVSGTNVNFTTSTATSADILHACSTMQNADDVATSFGVKDGTNILIDRGYAGFDAPVHSHINWLNGAPVLTGPTLDEHAKRLYERLAIGDVLQIALNSANTYRPPKTFGGVYLPMKLEGDENARIRKVYTGADSAPASPREWYLVDGQ